eukprot:NODE_21738_length_739_cov_2.767974.p1 GENE.NODE_21738_length_739_cov_2.767974~~NODE_21738_length_739_cov_2.767974.p1  ORF type:complete len:205 (+),score=56.00 NODE_21738_length_739_cov_2.767974:110-724(+)
MPSVEAYLKSSTAGFPPACLINECIRSRSCFIRKNKVGLKLKNFTTEPGNLTSLSSTFRNGLTDPNAINIRFDGDSKEKIIIETARWAKPGKSQKVRTTVPSHKRVNARSSLFCKTSSVNWRKALKNTTKELGKRGATLDESTHALFLEKVAKLHAAATKTCRKGQVKSGEKKNAGGVSNVAALAARAGHKIRGFSRRYVTSRK